MTGLEIFRIAWPIGVVIVAFVGAFAVVRVTVTFLKNGVKENKAAIKQNEEYINRNCSDIKVVNSDIAHIREILETGKIARETAQKQHAERLKSIEEKFSQIATKAEIKESINDRIELVETRLAAEIKNNLAAVLKKN